MTIVDDYSRCTQIHMMKLKLEVVSILHNFVSYVHTQFHTHVQCIRTVILRNFVKGISESFMLKRVYITREVMLTLHNKIELRRENTNIY